jgi:hypothetical protein
MLSSVLNSERAVQVKIAIMRAFVRLRELSASHKTVLRQLDEMECGMPKVAVYPIIVYTDFLKYPGGGPCRDKH